MRIAIAGSHATGKSTLVAELARLMPAFTVVEEQYYELLAAGHAFSETPTIDDFETLFQASVATLVTTKDTAVVFDRSPVDYLAYLVALKPRTPLAQHVAAAVSALESLDLIVYVPVERPDRVADPELPRLRRRVDVLLREMLVSQSWGWTTPCLEVGGTAGERAAEVVRHLEAHAAAQERERAAELPNERYR